MVGVASVAALLVAGGVASAGPTQCSGWGPGGYAVGDLKACVTVTDNTVSGRGLLKRGGPTSTANAVMWIQVYDLDRGKRLHTHMGNTVSASGLEPGRYEVNYYRGDGKGVQSSPVVVVR